VRNAVAWIAVAVPPLQIRLRRGQCKRRDLICKDGLFADIGPVTGQNHILFATGSQKSQGQCSECYF
jgi:hypothetical protein